jgi:hypothetical protein
MKKSILFAAALIALGGCVSHNFSEGKRTNYACDAGKEFSMREVAGSVEVYASGQTHLLRPSGEGAYSDGAITYTASGDNAALTGVYNGPFENCRGRAQNSWFPTLW